MSVPLTVVIPTLNEEGQIASALESLRWADEVIVADGGSSDRTVELARGGGAAVIEVRGKSIGAQRNAAIAQARNEWVLALDADERVTDALREELGRVLATPAHEAYRVRCENYFLVRERKRGRWGRDRHVRLFRRRRLPQVRLSLGARASGVRAAPTMRLPILMYHKVDRPPPPPGARYLRNYVLPEQFDAQLAALRRWGYETISFADWLAYRRRERTLPRRPIILTFDDGYRSTYEVAWPLLKRHHATASVFLVSDLIGKTNAWDADEIQQPLLDTRQIAAMRAGRIEFGSHTRTHPALTALPPDRVLAELRDSRTALEQLLDEPVRVLCYPYGKQNAAVRALAREAGYEAAVIARRRLNSHASDPLRLTRLRIDTTTRLPALRWTLLQLRWLWWT